MAVVINEFEVVPQSGPPASTAQPGGSSATASVPGNVVREMERNMRKKAERQHRLDTY